MASVSLASRLSALDDSNDLDASLDVVSCVVKVSIVDRRPSTLLRSFSCSSAVLSALRLATSAYMLSLSTPIMRSSACLRVASAITIQGCRYCEKNSDPTNTSWSY